MSDWSAVHRRKEAKETKSFIEKLENMLDELNNTDKISSEGFSSIRKIIYEFKQKYN